MFDLFEKNPEREEDKKKLITPETLNVIENSLTELRANFEKVSYLSSKVLPNYLLQDEENTSNLLRDIKDEILALVDGLEGFIKRNKDKITEFLGKHIAGIGYAKLLRSSMIYSGSPDHMREEELLKSLNNFEDPGPGLGALILQCNPIIKRNIINICIKYLDLESLNRDVRLPEEGMPNKTLTRKDLEVILFAEVEDVQQVVDEKLGIYSPEIQKKLIQKLYSYIRQMQQLVGSESYSFVMELFVNIISARASYFTILDQFTPPQI